MYAYAEVGTDYEHGDVEPQSGTCAEGEVAQECGCAQLSARTALFVFESPDVACVKEYGTVERTGIGNRSSVLARNMNVPV